jgi:NTP pyrophosphatase (non-canonical NTP hydrolase)
MNGFVEPREIPTAERDDIPPAPTLFELQTYVRRIKRDRGHADAAASAVARLSEEVDELTAAMAQAGLPSRVCGDDRRAIAFEIADTLIFLLDVATQYGIDVEEALRAKEAVNRQRHCAVSP